MKLKSFLLFLPLLFVGTGALAQVGYTHIELQGGYELFPDMSKKSGGNLNFGVRYAFSERYFMLLSCTVVLITAAMRDNMLEKRPTLSILCANIC